MGTLGGGAAGSLHGRGDGPSQPAPGHSGERGRTKKELDSAGLGARMYLVFA